MAGTTRSRSARTRRSADRTRPGFPTCSGRWSPWYRRTRWRWRVALHPPKWEEFHGETKLGTLDGIITFQETQGGTRVQEVGTFTAKGLGRLLGRVLRRSLTRLLREDFKEHWEQFRAERDSR